MYFRNSNQEGNFFFWGGATRIICTQGLFLTLCSGNNTDSILGFIWDVGIISVQMAFKTNVLNIPYSSRPPKFYFLCLMYSLIFYHYTSIPPNFCQRPGKRTHVFVIVSGPVTVEQCFSNLNVYQNHIKNLLNWRHWVHCLIQHSHRYCMVLIDIYM